MSLTAFLKNANAYLLFYRRRTNSPLGGKSFLKPNDVKQESEQKVGGADPHNDSLDDPQLPTPPNELVGLEPMTVDDFVSQPNDPDDRWLLRNVESNAASSVPSPPDDEPPDLDLQSYPSQFTRFVLPDPANKASPTSSNEADADLEADDIGWDEPLESSLEQSSGSPSSNWDPPKNESDPYPDHDDPFEDANVQKTSDEQTIERGFRFLPTK